MVGFDFVKHLENFREKYFVTRNLRIAPRLVETLVIMTWSRFENSIIK